MYLRQRKEHNAISDVTEPIKPTNSGLKVTSCKLEVGSTRSIASVAMLKNADDFSLR